ncbi:hypothetical protein KOW79_019668 [Hemibagrus wyckioides]|uniref:Uncharacterized protein n=1 Tax=Hemibagrus wyckioides TaxID=337641 RepID=A0A9D3NA80_9TELE|nr:hypothetical protein KOW79_019668 [Hemibagrus wyckioides]
MMVMSSSKRLPDKQPQLSADKHPDLSPDTERSRAYSWATSSPAALPTLDTPRRISDTSDPDSKHGHTEESEDWRNLFSRSL